MNKIILALAATLISASAQADIITCNFTEPFVTTVYSMAQQKLTYWGMGNRGQDEIVKVVRNVSFQILGPAKYQLRDKNGNVLQSLELNYRGSDGMSDNVYPYDVKDTDKILKPNFGLGGCSSNFLKAKTN